MSNVLSVQYGSFTPNQCWESCEHVEAGKPGVAVLCEDDSFGPVSRFSVCQACLDADQQQEADKIVVCCDCHQKMPAKNTISWTWYDFYAAQGDRPLIICCECQSKPKHVNRVDYDRDDYDREFNNGGDDFDDI